MSSSLFILVGIFVLFHSAFSMIECKPLPSYSQTASTP